MNPAPPVTRIRIFPSSLSVLPYRYDAALIP
jgi:hypothetical protein